MIQRHKNIIVLSACILNVVIIAGCTTKQSPANWQHPTLAKELWAKENGYCRRHARRETDMEAGLAATGPSSSHLPGGISRHRASMTQFQLQRFQQRTFNSCMKRRGFVPIVK